MMGDCGCRISYRIKNVPGNKRTELNLDMKQYLYRIETVQYNKKRT